MAKEPKYSVGQKFYNRGDMANVPGWFIVESVEVSKFGVHYRMQEIDGERNIFIPEVCLSDVDKGNGSTRIVTEKAYTEYKEAQLAQLWQARKARKAQ